MLSARVLKEKLTQKWKFTCISHTAAWSVALVAPLVSASQGAVEVIGGSYTG